MSSNSDLSITFSEAQKPLSDLHVEVKDTTVPKKASDIQVSVKEAPIELPDYCLTKHNLLKILENQLIKEYTKAEGKEIDPSGLSDNARDAYMKKILPCIKNFHGKFDRENPNKCDSAINLATYYGFEKRDENTGEVILDPKTNLPAYNPDFKFLKVKMNWQFEVEFFGQSRTLEYNQFLQTGALLPISANNFDEINAAKLSAVLTGKVHRKLLKTIFTSGKHEFKTGSGVFTPQYLIDRLHETNYVDISHRPNPYSVEFTGFWGFPTIGNHQAADFSHVKVGECAFSLQYGPRWDTKGRKLEYYDQDHHKLPEDQKAQAVYTKAIKVKVHNPRYLSTEKQPGADYDGTSYDQYLKQQGYSAIINDPELKAYNELSKMKSPDIRSAFTQKSEEVGSIQDKYAMIRAGYWIRQLLDEQKYREYLKALFEAEFKKLFHDDMNLRTHLLDAITTGASEQGFIGSIIAFGINVQEFFSENSALRNMLKEQAKASEKNLEDYKNAVKSGDVKEKAKVLDDMSKSYKQMKQMLDFVSKFKASIEIMERYKDQLSQFGDIKGAENSEKLFLYTAKSKIDRANEMLELYSPISNGAAKHKEIEGILKASNKI
jgi:hypothetical protein